MSRRTKELENILNEMKEYCANNSLESLERRLRYDKEELEDSLLMDEYMEYDDGFKDLTNYNDF